MLLKDKKTDFSFTDARGSLTQLVHEGYQQVNVLFTRSGVNRGGHYHKTATECFYVVSGSVEVTASRDGVTEKRLFGRESFFQVDPYVLHSMYFPEDCVLVAMYDICVERPDGTKDIYAG